MGSQVKNNFGLIFLKNIFHSLTITNISTQVSFYFSSYSGQHIIIFICSRAIGARPKDILQQILSESMVLTTIAGMCGISFAVMVLQLVEMGANADGGDVRFQVTFGLAIGTCALLIALGMLAGLAPAYRAMAIKPIEAIRDE